jgi:uncharacterized membrane protein HdeD (DUF308 family)
MAHSGSLAGDWAEQARKNSGWVIVLGVLTILAGIFAVAAPFMAGVTISVFVGVSLVVAGVFWAIGAFQAASFGQGVLAFLGGVLSVLGGLALWFQPVLGLASLAIVLAAYFFAQGIASCMLALKVKPASGWGWMLFSGILSVLLGIMIMSEWPLSGAWAIGVLVGVQLISAGWTMVMVASGVRRATKGA